MGFSRSMSLGGIFLGAWAFLSIHSLQAETELRGRKIFQKVRPNVFVIKTSTSVNAPRRSYGSAFVVSKSGQLITNFHVVAEAFSNPKIYQIYVGQNDDWKTARIINVDVIHDLALIEIPDQFRSALILNEKPLAVGDHVFSLGLPQDLNISIIDGVFNGLVRNGPYEQISLSSPLNSGMSGGPTVDRNGNVIGVNVAVMNDAQNLSFAIPASYVSALLKSKPASDLKEVARNQLFSVQAELTSDALDKREALKLPGWRVLKPSNSLKCYSDRRFEHEKFYEELFQYCYLPNSSYLDESISTGTYEIHMQVIQNKSMDRFQKYALTDLTYNEGFVYRHDRALYTTSSTPVTRNDCQQALFKNSQYVLMKVNYCVNAYVSYPGLYQMDVKLVTLNSETSTLFLYLRFLGFEKKNLTQMLSAFMDSVARMEH